MSNPEKEKEVLVQRGIYWLKCIFGQENVTRRNKFKRDVLEVDCSKLVRDGCTRDEIIGWLNEYLRQAGSSGPSVFNGLEPCTLIISSERFTEASVVDSLGRLSFELVEHKLAQRYQIPKQPHPKDDSAEITPADLLAYLSCNMPHIPVAVSDLITQLEDAPLKPKPSVPVALSERFILNVLQEATGINWRAITSPSFKGYATTHSYSNSKSLSDALRTTLKSGQCDRDLPHFSHPDYKNNVLIPFSYINSANIGMLLESKDNLTLAFTGRQPGQSDLTPL